MAGKLTFILGGCRSGKSAFALSHANSLAIDPRSEKTFIATAPALDGEMRIRIAKHQAERRTQNWRTVEEQTDLANAIASVPDDGVILVDCLTLWVNNVIHHGDAAGTPPDESAMAALAEQAAGAALARAGATVMVANEVGLGIAPDNPLARRFRDLAGRVNQTAAARADVVYFMVAGIPAKIKG